MMLRSLFRDPPTFPQSGSDRILGADDPARPGLVFGSWCGVRDDHLHGLDLQVLGRDRTELVCDLVSLHRNVLSFNIGDVYEDVLSTVSRSDVAVTLRPREVFTHARKHGTRASTNSRRVRARAFGGQRTR